MRRPAALGSYSELDKSCSKGCDDNPIRSITTKGQLGGFLGFTSRRAQLRWNRRPHLLNNCGRFMLDYSRRPSSLMLSSQLPLTIWPRRSRKPIPSMFPSLRLMRFLCSPGKPKSLVASLPRSWRLKTSPLTPVDKHVCFQREAYIASLPTAPCLSS